MTFELNLTGPELDLNNKESKNLIGNFFEL